MFMGLREWELDFINNVKNVIFFIFENVVLYVWKKLKRCMLVKIS